MSKAEFVRRFTSRKFLVALFAIIAPIFALYGKDLSSDTIEAIITVVTTITPAIAYIIVEGKKDIELAKASREG